MRFVYFCRHCEYLYTDYVPEMCTIPHYYTMLELLRLGILLLEALLAWPRDNILLNPFT